ncbi:zinc finger protein 24 isoform X3 [Triplophysa dalaica]|nr:zinc finger protein 24 isoform X3 [Triplophysa dalaica]XP_056598077.1 zinc finger protein 24 isoform X3 [Triplophysa dalaica]
MLLETSTKEKENQRLRATLQSRKQDGAGKGKSNASKGRKETKQHAPSQSSECGAQSETLRREQKGRAVGQLKAVMEHVLVFAVCELTKIVEDSFDDLLVEFTEKERENQILKDQLRDQNEEEDDELVGGQTKDYYNDSDSPSSSKVERRDSSQEPLSKKGREKEPAETTNEPDKQTVIAVAQDWVPILDKVFGQKWCSDLWQIKEVTSEEECTALGSGSMTDVDSLIRETLMPSCLATQKKLDVVQPPWSQSEEMEVLSLSADSRGIVSSTGDDSHIRSSSMLQRLLTLPSQLLEGDEESMDAAPSLEASLDPAVPEMCGEPKSDRTPATIKREQRNEEKEEDEPDEDDDDETKQSKHKGRRKAHVCKECGRKFSRTHLLRAHRLTHEETANRCSQCGKSFSQPSKLQAHLRTHAAKAV